MFPLEDATIFRSSLVKGKCGPYIVIAFFICCMWKRLIPSYWGIMCPWVSGFLKTGKMEKALVLETCDCKTSNSESHSWRRTSKCKYEFNFHATKEGFVLVFCKYESVPRTYHYCPEEHCQFWCQKTSDKGETFGVAPVGRGGAFGVAGVGLVRKFWNILCCSNWPFYKVVLSTWYSCNKCSVCCRILGGLEFTLKWQNYCFNERP